MLKKKLLRELTGWFFAKHPGLAKWKEQNFRLDFRVWAKEFDTQVRMNPEPAAIGKPEANVRFSNSSWWEWLNGSHPHFWQWSDEYMKTERDGVVPWMIHPLPRWQVPQRLEKDPQMSRAMHGKLDKIRRQGYLQPGKVDSLTSYFAVPKGDTDIRMVYDHTKSGLNDAMWAPWFALPTIETHLRFVSKDSYMGDMDIGDMFHHFILHESVQRLAGIDLTPFYPEELREDLRMIWERWVRCAMGLKSSPYNTIQEVLFVEEMIRGDPSRENNIFRWSYVRLNLPGSVDYRPHLSWVSKIRADGKIANDFVTYVDDTRTCGNSWKEARLATRVVASKLNWLGIQDVA
jgi:hypothetical protein